MINFEKRLFVALSLSSVIMLLNITAVINGSAESYYAQLSLWLHEWFA